MNIDPNALALFSAPGRPSPVNEVMSIDSSMDSREAEAALVAVAPAHHQEAVVDAGKEDPPGKETFTHPKYEEMWEQITTDMVHNKIHLATKGSKKSRKGDTMTARWNKFCFEEFYYSHTIDGRRVPGSMTGFRMWTSKDPGIKKFKPLMWNVIVYFSDQYEVKLKRNEEPSTLEMQCHHLQRQINIAEAASAAKTAAKQKKIAMIALRSSSLRGAWVYVQV